MSEETKNQTKAKTEPPRTEAHDAAARSPFAAFDPMAMWSVFGNPVAAWTAAQTAFQNQMTAAQSAFQNALNAMTSMSSATGANPFAAWTNAAQSSFGKIIGDSFVRTQAWSDEYAANEAQMVSKAHGAIDTWAQLAHETINYSAQLSAQARKLSFDAARKAGFAGA